MGDLTNNLSRSEIACSCGCGFDTIDFKTVNLIQEYADWLGTTHNTKVKVSIEGGNRCKEHNEVIQKKYNKNYVPYSSKSTHIDAKAVDIKYFILKGKAWVQIKPIEVNSYFDTVYPTTLGLGIYTNRNHIDSREVKARWDTTK